MQGRPKALQNHHHPGQKGASPAPERVSGRHGRIAKTDAQNLHEAVAPHEDEVLRFASDPDLPFTNNRAEREIRMAKVGQKVSGCSRTLRHAQAHYRISSYLQSMALQGWDPLAAIEIALNGNAADMVGKTPPWAHPGK